MAKLKVASLLLLLVFGLSILFLRIEYVETGSFPDRTTAPRLASSTLELVAELPSPPGNITLSGNGDIFFTLHPEASAENRGGINVAKWVEGKVQPFPSMAWQPGGSAPFAFNEVLSVRMDKKQQLWVLDNGLHGLNKVRLLAFDIDSGEMRHRQQFSRKTFGLGSHANDFRISHDGQFIIITDASVLAKTPALIIYDVKNQRVRRVLENHESVVAGNYQPIVQGREMTLFGLFTVNPGVDGIALDHANEYLYYASISADQLYRVPFQALVDSLKNPEMDEAILAQKVEAIGEKTMTDGMAIDANNAVYLSDLEHSAIVRRNPEGELQTLLKSASIRWPDGFSFGPNGYLYFTCSSLHQVVGMSNASVEANGPYQIYRFNPF